MEYIEIDFDCGSSLKDSVKLLHSKTEVTGKKYFGEFNGHKLTSDILQKIYEKRKSNRILTKFIYKIANIGIKKDGDKK